MVMVSSSNFLDLDLDKQKIIRKDQESISFEIDSFRKKCLLEGLDDISLTLSKTDSIEAYETKLKNSHPWII